jgi:hypothetical protein
MISFLVCETSWADVFDAGIGGQRTHSDREEPRVPSAYLLVYINADQKSISNGEWSFRRKLFVIVEFCLDIQYELPADLQRVLDDDLVLLQQQNESIRLEKLHSDLKSICERNEKQQPIHRALTIPFFAGQNAPSGMLILNQNSFNQIHLFRFGDR